MAPLFSVQFRRRCGRCALWYNAVQLNLYSPELDDDPAAPSQSPWIGSCANLPVSWLQRHILFFLKGHAKQGTEQTRALKREPPTPPKTLCLRRTGGTRTLATWRARCCPECPGWSVIVASNSMNLPLVRPHTEQRGWLTAGRVPALLESNPESSTSR